MQTVDFAIICALREEREAVLRHFKIIEAEDLGGWNCTYTQFENKHDKKTYSLAVVELGQMGNLGSLAACSTIIRELAPYNVFLVGICGGLRKPENAFKLGDVVVGDTIIYYEPGKVFASHTEPRHRKYKSPVDWSGSVKEITGGSWTALDVILSERPDDSKDRTRPAVMLGEILSGEKVITSSELTQELCQIWPNAVSIEMEAAGIAYACQGTNTGFLVVKSVSDSADGYKNDSFRNYACATAGAFVKCLLEETVFPDFLPNVSFVVPLGDLLRLKKNNPTRIILPSYPNPRHQNCRITNYPWNLYESAFDDVFSALRIMPAIEAYCGRDNVTFYFDQSPQLPHTPNSVYIGSSISNQLTRAALRGAYFQFGPPKTAQDHDIVDRKGKTVYAAEKIGASQGSESFIKDYALLSALESNGERVVVVAGCRAYGQLILGDLLSNPRFVREFLLKHVYGKDFQCVVEVEVAGREYCMSRIPEIVVRVGSNWERVFFE